MNPLDKYELLGIYCDDIPEFIKKFACTEAMQRLTHIGMNCGCEYTQVHKDTIHNRYTRFEHSVGVALIIWNFTHDIKQSLAGLFHDISTPAFAHVVDYMNGDHITQESTEASTADFIDKSEEIQKLFREYGLSTADVCDYHMYPIADNDTPQLSADRLEYTFGNFLQYDVTDVVHIETFYRDLTVGVNEYGEDELMFADKTIAEEFAFYTMKCSYVYVSDADRFTMQYLADLLKFASDNGVVRVKDLYTSEENVIEKLERNELTSARWSEYCKISRVNITSEKVSEKYCIKVNAKRRYIDPFVKNIGRVTQFNAQYRVAVDELLNVSFDGWMSIA